MRYVVSARRVMAQKRVISRRSVPFHPAFAPGRTGGEWSAAATAIALSRAEDARRRLSARGRRDCTRVSSQSSSCSDARRRRLTIRPGALHHWATQRRPRSQSARDALVAVVGHRRRIGRTTVSSRSAACWTLHRRPTTGIASAQATLAECLKNQLTEFPLKPGRFTYDRGRV